LDGIGFDGKSWDRMEWTDLLNVLSQFYFRYVTEELWLGFGDVFLDLGLEKSSFGRKVQKSEKKVGKVIFPDIFL